MSGLLKKPTLLQASLDAGRAIAAFAPSDRHPQPAVKHETPQSATRQLNLSDIIPNGVGVHANAVALPVTPVQSIVGTNQLQPAPLNSLYTPTAARQPDINGGIDSARSGDNAVGQLQAALGQIATSAPRASGTALPEVCAEVHDLRQSFGSLLQRMTTLQANLHGMEQLPESRTLTQLEPKHAQHGHAAGPMDTHQAVQTTYTPKELKAATGHLVNQVPMSQEQHSMHSVRQAAEQTGKKPPAVKHLWGAVVRQQPESILQALPEVDDKNAGVTTQAASLDGAPNEAPMFTNDVPMAKPLGTEGNPEPQPIVVQVLLPELKPLSSSALSFQLCSGLLSHVRA